MLLPDPALVQTMDATVKSRLRLALDHLVSEVLDRDAPGPIKDPTPSAFALQALMRNAAMTGDVARIGELHDSHAVVLTGDGSSGLNVVAFDARHFGLSERILLQGAFRDDIGLTASLVAPPDDVIHQTEVGIALVRDTVRAAAPLWWEEFEAMVSTIVLATTEDTGKGFAGASAFDAWGAVLVNPCYRNDPLHLALTLIHESSHLKLFHAYLDDEIVLNDPDETYSSPLRRQPRPMNGIYHAAFVLARMARFSADMLQSGRATALAPASAWEEELARSVEHFEAAHGVIAGQGQLTDKGAALMAQAADGVRACKSILQSA